MKQLNFFVIMTVITFATSSLKAQTASVQLPIPKELQSTVKDIYAGKYYEVTTPTAQGGKLTMVFDSKYKVAKAVVTGPQKYIASIKKKIDERFKPGFRECVRKCEDKQSEGGVILCVVDCVLDVLL